MIEHPLDSKTLGSRLKKERHRLGLTQENVATAVGVTNISVYQFEKGKRIPHFKYLLGLRSIGFSLQFLIYGEHRVIVPGEQFVDAKLASEIYRLVDRYAVDAKGRSLHVDIRVELFDELVTMAINLNRSEVDMDAIMSAVEQFAA